MGKWRRRRRGRGLGGKGEKGPGERRGMKKEEGLIAEQ